ncbi:MAG: WG repeat-containing protein [Bacteroidia bacterium]|nr:WG repeat-containing protein [Bacteroidia bacterium]NNF30112.1 WG repeat-containing protein [Flavobacteriaceae bacterium]MBT8274990.1 WG repeat-containing protein [Bacteroidia bacterium]NNJ80590.1 WG repeat-containing protein [Flavobacteriaceae bacterium]NNK55525.1 WG repeat-containing protein [Flavobacteriaceae bacterium]
MRYYIVILVTLMLVPFSGATQVLEGIDYITPFHEELAAVKKGDQWAFVNTKGDIVIDFRDNLVWSKAIATETKKGYVRKEPTKYPRFTEDRCLIFKMKDGFKYYGYMDKTGKTVIAPEFINARVFDNGYAIVLKVTKEIIGRNEILGKDVISYSYAEQVIDPEGSVKAYLKGPVNLVMSVETKKQPPAIKSYIFSPDMVAFHTNDKKWKLIRLDSFK